MEENGAELEIGAGRRLGRKTGLGGAGARGSAGARHKAAGAYQGEREQAPEGKGTDAGWALRLKGYLQGGRKKASMKPFRALACVARARLVSAPQPESFSGTGVAPGFSHLSTESSRGGGKKSG